MAEKTGIEWCDHTFNPWVGCQAVSDACKFCYAEALVKRFGGNFAERRRTSATNWRGPVHWNRKAAGADARRKVFCASLADVFDNQVPDEWRADLWNLIRYTPNLDWLLLTKRPQNIEKMLPPEWADGWPNVWLGTTVENQTEADRRIPHLLAVPARVRFLSCEPLLGPLRPKCLYPVDDGGDGIPDVPRIDWLICGGESGPGRRPMNLEWARSLRDQCAEAGVPFFGKQFDKVSPLPDDLMVREFPDARR